jgi:hypothetical protein
MYARKWQFHCHSVCLCVHNRETYRYCHRVGRVLSFSPVVGIGTLPTPHPQASVPPPPGSGGGAHSLARDWVGESQFRRGDINVVLYKYMYFFVVIVLLPLRKYREKKFSCTPTKIRKSKRSKKIESKTRTYVSLTSTIYIWFTYIFKCCVNMYAFIHKNKVFN